MENRETSRLTAQVLVNIPLFSTMTEEERTEVFSLMTERVFAPGQLVMQADSSEPAFHIIEQGEAEIWLTDTDGKKVLLNILGPGTFFGELSMLSGDTRSASATSQGELVTLELTQEEFFDFLRRRPHAALEVLTELAERLKQADDLVRTRASRNPNEIEEPTSLGQQIADVIAEFSGSILFLVINAIAFTAWILINIAGPLLLHFDPYPFQFLTMAVSLEAIFLSIFVLVSQNRQASKDRLKADLDYQVDVKTELGMNVVVGQVREMQNRLHQIQRDVTHMKMRENDHTK